MARDETGPPPPPRHRRDACSTALRRASPPFDDRRPTESSVLGRLGVPTDHGRVSLARNFYYHYLASTASSTLTADTTVLSETWSAETASKPSSHLRVLATFARVCRYACLSTSADARDRVRLHAIDATLSRSQRRRRTQTAWSPGRRRPTRWSGPPPTKAAALPGACRPCERS